MFLTTGSSRAKRWKNRLKWAVTLSGAGMLLFSLSYGLDKSDQFASFVCGLVLLLSGFQLFPVRGPGPGVEAILPDLRKDIDEFWRKERRARGLAGAELMPIRLRTQGTSGHLAIPHAGLPVWPSHQYAMDVAALVTDSTLTRAVIHGPPGVGKTTFAIMLTSGVVRGDTHVPLYLSLASWSPGEERFRDWFDRQVAAAYPSLRALHPRNDTLLERLAIDRIVLILDGLDEIRGPVRTDALKKIDEAVDRDQSLIVLTRSAAQPPSLTGGSVLVLERLEAEDAAAYLTVRLLGRAPATARPALRRLCSALRTGAVPDVAEMLRTPLYLDLLCRAAEGDEGVPTRFLDEVERHGADAGKQLLYSTFVDQALRRTRLGASSRRLRRARRWAACMAFEMSRPSSASRTLAWWRIYERVPATVFGAATAVAVAPAYRLCLLMPPGLTRGFAIGIVTSFVLGACRGVNTRPAAPVAAVASAASVLVVGTWLLDGRQAVVDACEIGAAIGLVFFFKSQLCGRWPACVGAVLLTGGASALAVYAANAVLPPGTAPARTPAGVLLAVVTGIAIATLAARLLTRPGGPLRPSTASLHLRESLGLPLRPVFTATCAASAAGLGGAFVGAATQGLQHGLHVGIVFALVLGPAIGLPAGLIAWLNQPSRLPSASALRTYQHDRALAWLCFAGVTTTATATQIALDGLVQSWIDRLGDSSFTAQPVHGLLFGMTIGIVVAAYNTAWPNYVLCITWFAARRLLPWRFMRFLGLLHKCEILRQEGPLYSFRAVELQTYLAATYVPARGRGRGAPGSQSELPEQNRGTGARTCGPTSR